MASPVRKELTDAVSRGAERKEALVEVRQGGGGGGGGGGWWEVYIFLANIIALYCGQKFDGGFSFQTYPPNRIEGKNIEEKKH